MTEVSFASAEGCNDKNVELVLELLKVGLEAADGSQCVYGAWPEIRDEHELQGPGSIDVLAVGKASRSMFEGLLHSVSNSELSVKRTLLVVPEEGGHDGEERATSPSCRSTSVFEAEHPLPGPSGALAGKAVLRFVEQGQGTLVVLLSGGASAMLHTPLPGVTLENERRFVDHALRSGASIDELNLLRKPLSEAKGGRLAARSNYQKVVVLVLSDVVGSDLGTIGSGPFFCEEPLSSE